MNTRELDMAMETKPRRLQGTAGRQEQNAFLPEADLMAQTLSPLGNASTAGIHASRLNRIMASQPSQTGHSLLQLQRQYGNHYVQRVLALARKADSDSEVSSDVEDAIQRALGSGQPLDNGVRTQMESAFDADFSGVRVHADAEAKVLNRAVSARAFTTGQDVFFSEGAYNPGSSSGRELIAHELTHVVQQTSPKIKRKLTVGQPNDKYEQEADAVASEIVKGPRRAGEFSIARQILAKYADSKIVSRRTTPGVQRLDVSKLPTKTLTINVTILEGSTRSADVSTASQVLKNAAKIELSVNVLKKFDAATSKKLIGDDLIVEEYADPAKPTAEELALTAENRTAGTITAYFVKAMSAGSHGEAFIPSTPSAPPSVIIKNGDSPFAAGKPLAHELGHVLLDEGGHPPASGNIMDYSNDGVGMTEAQVIKARSSSFVK